MYLHHFFKIQKLISKIQIIYVYHKQIKKIQNLFSGLLISINKIKLVDQFHKIFYFQIEEYDYYYNTYLKIHINIWMKIFCRVQEYLKIVKKKIIILIFLELFKIFQLFLQNLDNLKLIKKNSRKNRLVTLINNIKCIKKLKKGKKGNNKNAYYQKTKCKNINQIKQ